jgi:hypothetical protein
MSIDLRKNPKGNPQRRRATGLMLGAAALSGGVMATVLILWDGLAARAHPRPHATAAASTGAASDRNMEQLNAALQSTQRRLDQLEAQTAQVIGTAQNVNPTAAPDPDAVVDLEEVQKKADRVREQLDEIVRTEPRDQAWAGAYEGYLRQSAEAALHHPDAESVKSVSCSSSLCRLEVMHRSEGDSDSYATDLREKVPDVTFRVSKLHGDDGSYVTVVHVIRQGYPIPDLR